MSKIRTSESRSAEARKLKERVRRGKPGEGPNARVKPVVLTPEERNAPQADDVVVEEQP